MKPPVQEKLNNFFRYPLFENVGKSLPSGITPVKNWAGATRMCRSQKWDACQLMARNALFRFVQTKSWHRAQEWGPLADELRPLIVAFADALASKTPLPAKDQKPIKDTLSWDIMLICFEHEYRDLVEPFFYLPIVEPWYANGHFPCGWDGDEFSDCWDGIVKGGQLMVF